MMLGRPASEPPIEKGSLYELYHIRKMSMKEIASFLSPILDRQIYPSGVKRWLVYYEIPSRNHTESAQLAHQKYPEIAAKSVEAMRSRHHTEKQRQSAAKIGRENVKKAIDESARIRKSKRVSVECAECHKMFKIAPYRIRRNVTIRFCGLTCHALFRNRERANQRQELLDIALACAKEPELAERLGITNQLQSKLAEASIACKYCGSVFCQTKGGFTRTGKPRVICKVCNRSYLLAEARQR